MADASQQQYLIRDAVIGDREEIGALLAGLGLNMPRGSDAIGLHWRQMWTDNPAVKAAKMPPMIGKVLETNNEIVGFFGNIPLLYFLGDENVSLNCAIHWGVVKEHRGETNRLAAAYFDQPNADLLLVTTTNRAAGRLFLESGYKKVPQPDYDMALYWITNAAGFLEAAFRKRGLPSALAVLLGRVGGLAAGIALAVTRRRPKGAAPRVDVIGVDGIDESFDDLWRSKRDEAKRLLACRSGDSLRWHFGIKSLADRCRFLTCRQGGKLKGYAAVLREDSPEIGLKRLRVVDIFIAGDNQDVLSALLSRAYALAAETGCHILEVIGLPASIREQIHGHRPFVRRMPTWPLYYKPCNDRMEGEVAPEAVWYVTPYDGDTSLL